MHYNCMPKHKTFRQSDGFAAFGKPIGIKAPELKSLRSKEAVRVKRVASNTKSKRVRATPPIKPN